MGAFWGNSNALILVLIWWRVIVELSSRGLHLLLFVDIWTSRVAAQFVDRLVIVVPIVAACATGSAILQVLLRFQNAVTCDDLCVVLWIGRGGWLIDGSMIYTLSIVICELLIHIRLEHGVRLLCLWVCSYHCRWFLNLIHTLLEYAASIWFISRLWLLVSKAIWKASYGSVRSGLHMMRAWSSRHSYLLSLLVYLYQINYENLIIFQPC